MAGEGGGDGRPAEVFGEVETLPASAACLRRLGNLPFWRGDAPLLAALEPTYEVGGRRGLDTFLGGKPGRE